MDKKKLENIYLDENELNKVNGGAIVAYNIPLGKEVQVIDDKTGTSMKVFKTRNPFASGKKLMSSAEAWAREHGLDTVRISLADAHRIASRHLWDNIQKYNAENNE